MEKISNEVFSYFDFKKENSSREEILFICDHSSNQIPNSYNNLGLDKKNISSHIAFDIGSRLLTIQLTKQLKACCFVSNFSRLLIDPNRKLKDDDLILEESFGTKVPGNSKIKKEEKNKRINKFYTKYHTSLNKVINKLALKKKINLISIHSFTQKYKTFNRPNEIGLLWNNDISLLVPMLKYLNSLNINVGNNYPYSGHLYNHTLDFHSEKKKLPNLSIEIRNDLICNQKGINKWTSILKKSFETILESRRK